MSREVNSEGKKYLDNFEATYSLLFIQRELFDILLYDSILRHRDPHIKGNLRN